MQFDHTDDIESSLAELETQNAKLGRKVKLMERGILLALACFPLVFFAGSQKPEVIHQSIRARNFLLYDHADTLRATLTHDSATETTRLTLRGDHDETAELAIVRGAPQLVFKGRDKTTVVKIAAGDKNDGYIEVRDKTGVVKRLLP